MTNELRERKGGREWEKERKKRVRKRFTCQVCEPVLLIGTPDLTFPRWPLCVRDRQIY